MLPSSRLVKSASQVDLFFSRPEGVWGFVGWFWVVGGCRAALDPFLLLQPRLPLHVVSSHLE